MQIHGYDLHVLVKGVTERASIQPNLNYHEWICIFILLNEKWEIHEPNVNNEKLPKKNLSTLFILTFHTCGCRTIKRWTL